MSRAFLDRNSQNDSNSNDKKPSQPKVDYQAQMKKLDMYINNPGWNTADISLAQMIAEEEEDLQMKPGEEEKKKGNDRNYEEIKELEFIKESIRDKTNLKKPELIEEKILYTYKQREEYIEKTKKKIEKINKKIKKNSRIINGLKQVGLKSIEIINFILSPVSGPGSIPTLVPRNKIDENYES